MKRIRYLDRFGKEPTGILERKKMKLEESPEEIRIAATGRRRWEHEENMRVVNIRLGARRRELRSSFENSLKVTKNTNLQIRDAQDPVSRTHKKEIHTQSSQ